MTTPTAEDSRALLESAELPGNARALAYELRAHLRAALDREAAAPARAERAEAERDAAREDAAGLVVKADQMAEALRERDGGAHDADCKALRTHGPKSCNCGHEDAKRTLAAWDRDEALRIAERLFALYHAHDPNSPNAFLLEDAAVLLRATAAEIVRLQVREDAAARTAAALRERDGGVHDPDCKIWRPAVQLCTCGHNDAVTALAAWDASRGER